jgi:Ca2+-binding EF-hand superfamily protein
MQVQGCVNADVSNSKMAHGVELDYFKSLQRFATLERPSTGSYSSFHRLKAGKARPVSAKRVSPARSKRASKGYEGSLSRENKTEENVQLKTQVNTLKSELLKLRVKLKTNEHGTRKDELSSERQTGVLALRQHIKELSRRLQAKEKDYDDLKHSIQSSSFQELEVQVKIYIDECTRLKRLLTEALQQLLEGVEIGDLAERYLALSIQLREQHKENEGDAQTTGNLDKKTGQSQDLAEKLRRTLMEVEEENTRVHRDNQHLINELQSIKLTLKCPNCELATMFNETIDQHIRPVNEILSELWRTLGKKGLGLREAWGVIDFNRLDIMKSAAFAEGLKRFGLVLSSMELTKLMLELNPTQGNKVSFSQFEEAMVKRRPEKEMTEVDISKVFTHIKMKLQVKRWEYQQLPDLLAPDRRDYYPKELCSTLEQEPFDLTKEQARGLVNFVFESNPSLKGKALTKRFINNLEVWEVLTEEEEQELDDVIRKALSQLNDQFVRLCSERDDQHSGIITLAELADVLQCLETELGRDVMEYLKLLCYTHNFELDAVPYMHLASAYIDEVYVEA